MYKNDEIEKIVEIVKNGKMLKIVPSIKNIK